MLIQIHSFNVADLSPRNLRIVDIIDPSNIF